MSWHGFRHRQISTITWVLAHCHVLYKQLLLNLPSASKGAWHEELLFETEQLKAPLIQGHTLFRIQQGLGYGCSSYRQTQWCFHGSVIVLGQQELVVLIYIIFNLCTDPRA